MMNNTNEWMVYIINIKFIISQGEIYYIIII